MGRTASDLVFVTATDVPVKTLNQILVNMFDFEYSDGIDDNGWLISTSDDVSQLSQVPTKPPVPEDLLSNNVWAGRSFEQVGKFMFDNKREIHAKGFSEGQCVILDQAGIASNTAVFWEHIIDFDEDDKAIETGRWQGIRTPLGHLHSVVCNLGIANMDFEDFVDEDAGLHDDGLHVFPTSRYEGGNENVIKSHNEAERKRSQAMRALQEQGHLDVPLEGELDRCRI